MPERGARSGSGNRALPYRYVKVEAVPALPYLRNVSRPYGACSAIPAPFARVHEKRNKLGRRNTSNILCNPPDPTGPPPPLRMIGAFDKRKAHILAIQRRQPHARVKVIPFSARLVAHRDVLLDRGGKALGKRARFGLRPRRVVTSGQLARTTVPARPVLRPKCPR
jgi:hypothetical protein